MTKHTTTNLLQQRSRVNAFERSAPFGIRRDVAYTVDTVLDDIDVPIEHVTEKVFDKCANPDSIKGSDATPFLPEPQTLKGVLRLPPRIREPWLKAYRNELVNMIVTKRTFSHPKNYRGEKCLPIRVVHKTKLRSDGKVDKVKVRAAIHGDLDTSGPKDEDNSAPLATFCTLKVFLAEAARQQRHVYQADYVGAYLQAKMDRVIYVTLPAALAEVFPDLAEWFGVPLLLEKAAYGINAAGRLWAKEQFTWYLEYGFTQSTVDPSLFYYTKGEDWIVLLSYCDDTAYFGLFC
jgi:Reverse transcriptase (RNA-dependent DNA polymerase)